MFSPAFLLLKKNTLTPVPPLKNKGIFIFVFLSLTTVAAGEILFPSVQFNPYSWQLLLVLRLETGTLASPQVYD